MMHTAGKKKMIFWIAVVLILGLCLAAFWPRKPFASLKQDDISSIDVSFGSYPEYPLTDTDESKIIEYLQTMTTIGKSYFYKSIHRTLDEKTYIETFIVHLNTGEDVTIEPDYPFVTIDGTVYHCNDKETLNGMIDIYNSYIDVIRNNSKPISMHSIKMSKGGLNI